MPALSSVMKRPSFSPERLLNAFPESREEILRCAARFKKYSRECGCSLGAVFLLSTLALFIAYHTIVHDWLSHLPRQILIGIALIFFSSGLGKLIGIGLARIKLAALQKHLVARFPLPEIHHVDLHEVGK